MKELIYHPESDCFFSGYNMSGPDYDEVHVITADQVPAGYQIKTGLSHSTSRPSMDFETYSEAGFKIDYEAKTVKGMKQDGKGGLPVVGTPVYAEHPSTEVLCLYYDLKDGQGRRSWIPGGPLPYDLMHHIEGGGEIEAFNVGFEWWIWNMVCVRKHGFPPLQLEQCFCVMAKARRHSLPGSLAKLAEALGTPDKDKAGKNLIQKLTRPHKPTKKRPAFRRTPATAWQDFVNLYRYCGQDVLTEDEANARLPDLTEHERAVWLVDQRINARGVQVDVATLDVMLELLGQTERLFTMELCQITQGAVGTVSEVENLRTWLAETQGVRLPNIVADTVQEALDGDYGDLTPPARRALEIRQVLSSANVKKIRTLKLQVSSDGRLRDQYMYCGADRTGRFSAGGVQLQNMTAKGPKAKECGLCGRIVGKNCNVEVLGVKGPCPACGANEWKDLKDWTIEAVEYAISDMHTHPLETLIEIWGDPIDLMCGCLRALFIAAEGKQLICVDFSAIEAVVLACLTRCQWRIDVFNGHGKIYETSASKITGVPFEEYLAYKQRTGQDHPDRKKIGKVAELASGYGGWLGAWKNFGADEHFNTDDEIKEKILAWRDASPEIVEFWGGQFRSYTGKPWDGVPELYGLEGAFINAVLNPGKCFSVIDITFGMYEDVLYVRLPSGRFLHYHQPELVEVPDRFERGNGFCYKLTFMGYNSNSQKGPIGWLRMETYGGRLCENVTQAVAADIQKAAMVNTDSEDYSVVMHTHDELAAEVPEGWGSIDEMAEIMTRRPQWASWWPIRADGWQHKRYQK